MNDSFGKMAVAAPGGRRIFLAAVGLAVLLCIVSCALILLIPTQSTSVDTVYRGF